jgi:acyl-CoA dehydrogenase
MNEHMIEDSVTRLFTQEVHRGLIERAENGEFPAALWQLVQDNGFTRLLAREDDGGIEADWETAFALLTGLGQHQVPLPVAETCIATLCLSAAGQPVPDAPIAVVGEKDALALTVDASGDGLRLSGTLKRVPWARWCSHVLVGLDGRMALLDLSAPGVTRNPARDLSRMPADDLVLDGASATAFDSPWPDLAWPIWTFGAAARAAMMVGALEFALDQAVQYAKDRVQFGKPIGKYQAIQQQLAQLAGEFASARVAALVACRDLPSLHQADASCAVFSTAVAKVRAGEAANRGTAIAHQVHGAIGFTYEHALNFATRRLWTWRSDFGAASWWAERLGQSFTHGRAEGFWPALTQRIAPQPLHFT